MNKIYKLFDEQFVLDLFKKEVLPLYPDFSNIKKIKIQAPKKNIWEKTYHVVIEYKTTFKTKEGRQKQLLIFCSAHSDEPRKNVFRALEFLWEHNFGNSFLTIPRPLFYSNYFQGTFYRGVGGHNLYNYIREDKRKEVNEIIPKAAQWFAKLHSLETKGVANFNPGNSRIRTVVPGAKHIFAEIKSSYPAYYNFYQKVYRVFIDSEEKFLSSTKSRWLIHGDAHPENIIKVSQRRIAAIDFTDICLADYARDLGCFIQQLEFMIMRKIKDKKYAEEAKSLFLDNYFKNVKINIEDDFDLRIKNYYNWTTIRTATFFLTKDNPEPERAKPLIKKVKRSLKI